MKLLKFFFIIATSLQLLSCVFIPHDVNFDPKLSYNSKTIGGDSSKIKLDVYDKRQDQELIGRRGNGMSSVARISNKQNLDKLIKEKLTEILQNNNFKISDKANKRLVVNLTNLKYSNFFGLISVGTSVDTVFEVFLYSNDKEIYRNIYRSNYEDDSYLIVPFASTNRKNINISFEKALNSILSDEKLIDELK